MHLTGRTLRRPVLDLAGVWRDTRLIVLVAQTAAVYAAILIPFKVGIPIIPGFVELRPANAVPIVAALLFGPVAAWGAAFGNVIGDCFGTLGPGSLFGFLGNFCYGYIPHLLRGHLGVLSSERGPMPSSWRQIIEFMVICSVASMACALVIGWGVDLLGLLPFWIVVLPIFLNNFLMGVLLAPPLLFFLYPRVKRWGLLYEDICAGARHEAIGYRWQQVRGNLPIAHSPSPIAMTSAETFLSVERVSFTYTGATRPALNGVSLRVRQGESVALMGRTGVGKSTLCYALNGLVPQLIPGRWSGQVTVNGHDTAGRPVWQQAGTVGLVFQDFEAQLLSTNVAMELAFPLEHLPQPLSPAAMASRIERALERVGLSGLERRDPLSLSGGQRQRLVIASTLIREPALVVLDEPMTDLDPEGRRTLASLLASMKAGGTALIVAEHDPEDAVAAERVCILDHGAVAWEGTPRVLFGDPNIPPWHGIRPLPLVSCFAGLNLPDPPMTVEEAWQVADEHGLVVTPDEAALRQETVREDASVIIDAHKVSYEYQRGSPVVSDLSFTIHDGEFVAIIGLNGSGKSTLAMLLSGLNTPTRGRVMVDGRDTRTLGAGQLATIVGYVFQNPDHQIFAETVGEEVAFGVRNLGFPPEECERRVAEALDAVGLAAPEIRKLDPFSLTKGDRQRVAVASVLAARPRILIFDEPTTGLDAEQTDRMMRMLRRLNQRGHTIVIITHTLPLVAAYAPRCAVMRDGRIVADGQTREIFRTLTDPEFAASVGLEVPSLTRFAARWGRTLLTVDEVRSALRRL
jgi:energy-coupling factor transporter ATP-binding protein EcfA2